MIRLPLRLWQKSAIVLYLFLLTRHSFTQAEICPNEEDGIGPFTLHVNKKEVYELKPTKRLEYYEAEHFGDKREQILEELTDENIYWQVKRCPKSIRRMADESTGQEEDLDFIVPHYRRACPHKWFLMRRGSWFWKILRKYESYMSIEYCFTYFSVWATYCPFCYCSFRHPHDLLWDPRYQCFPEHRLISLPMSCFHIKKHHGNIKYTWISWSWRRMPVPRGCCCRKFWYFYGSDECAASEKFH